VLSRFVEHVLEVFRGMLVPFGLRKFMAPDVLLAFSLQDSRIKRKGLPKYGSPLERYYGISLRLRRR
jgi:hypothetical protein